MKINRSLFTEGNSKVLVWLGAFIFFLGLVVFLYGELSTLGLDKVVDSTKIAEFGDFIGGAIGALWSLAGVILFYVALTEQRKDIEINRNALKAQIDEFKLQRGELEETRKVFQEQGETLKVQRFENTFFQLLHLHQEIIEKLRISDRDYSIEKREVFKYSVDRLDALLWEKKSLPFQNDSGGQFSQHVDPKSVSEAKENMFSACETLFFKDVRQGLSHYFRSVYHIFKFIYTTDLIESDRKQFYASIFRAQLSSDEQQLILYNSLTPNLGYPDFLFLIDELDILQNFDIHLFSRHAFHLEIYDEQKERARKETKIKVVGNN